MFRLRTVRAKLLSLVALSIVVTMAVLPLLSWLLHKQLLEEVDDSVQNASDAYQAELDDDILDMRLAATLLSNDTDVHKAIEADDAKTLQEMTESYAKIYPDIDIVFIRKDGSRLARIGCDADGPSLADRGVVKKALEGHAAEGLSARGCNKVPLPTYLIAMPANQKGVVIVGMDFSQSSLENTGKKLNLDLALVDPKGNLVNKTKNFPPGGEKIAANDPLLVEVGQKTYIMQPFFPKELKHEKDGQFALVAALDVTQVRTVIRQNLLMAMGFVVFAAIVAVGVGLRLASIMSGAMKRINAALKKLENQEYVKVQGVETGDELEDLASGFNHMVEGLQERDKLKTTFGKYMTASVMEHLMAGKVQLGGETLTATILFSDIRSFTSISEKMDAKSLVALLNEYFTEMVDVVIKEDGVVDKYIGDAIMAVFGAPVTKKDDAIHAVRAAIGMREALAKLNVKLKERGMTPLKTGIGVHTGEVVAGNIGSEKRMEYTVIGDAVNLASRLESSTKELGTPVLISEDTYALVKDHVDARAVKEITVKGREKPVMTYEVLGLKGEASAPKSDPVPFPKDAEA
ncbi:MAG TPA: adenylate/guanylate cyclase domain-containing protein [Polyangiaceae bacterium]